MHWFFVFVFSAFYIALEVFRSTCFCRIVLHWRITGLLKHLNLRPCVGQSKTFA